MSSVLIFLILAMFIAGSHELQQEDEDEEELVKVYSFQRGPWRASTDDVFLRFNFTRSGKPWIQLSICYRIRFEMFVKSNVHMSYTSTDDNSRQLAMMHRENTFNIWLDLTPQDMPLPEEVMPEVWYHICHLLQESAYVIYWQGQEVNRWIPLGIEWPISANGSLVVGQEQDALGGGFDATQIHRGDVAQLSIWDHLLDADTIGQMARCASAGRGDVFSSDTDEVELVGVEEQLVEAALLCREEQQFVFFGEERSLQEAKRVCSLLNASLAVPTSSRVNHLLTQQLFPLRDVCVPTKIEKLWLGVHAREEDGVLTEEATGRPLNYTNFLASESPLPRLRCTSLRADGFWELEYCEKAEVKKCFACSFEGSDFLRVRGFCFDLEMETKFRVQDSGKGRPIFRGYYGLLITWVTARWELVDPAANESVMWAVGVGNKAYPIGRREWRLLTETCGVAADESLVLSLSPCGRGDFMCDSGDCIAYPKRCNHHSDCPDQSDERNCFVVDEGDGFQRQMPPTGPSGGVLVLTPSLTLSRIASVDDLNMAVALEFQFTLEWIDDRLKFRHLRKSKKGTTLTEEESKKVWTPMYHMMNLDGGQSKLLSQSFLVKTALGAIPPNFNDVDTDIVYPGSANELSITQLYSVRMTCNFQLYAYPFDVQLCKIDIQLPPDYDGHVQFSSAEGELSYTGPQDLALYTVEGIRLWRPSEADRFVAEFSLRRRPGMLLLSTFVPSALLLLVSWSTLFVRLEALNVRAVMSLTTLLVLYTLFANMSRSLPTTASIKLIDIWFFFIIFILFTNIVVHIFVDRRDNSSGDGTKIFARPVQTLRPKAANFTTCEAMPPNLRFLNSYKLVILPISVVLFNIAFWTAVFVQ